MESVIGRVAGLHLLDGVVSVVPPTFHVRPLKPVQEERIVVLSEWAEGDGGRRVIVGAFLNTRAHL